MARKAVVDAVEARLQANWTHCPIVGMNTTGSMPSSAAAFLVVQFPVANEEMISVGAPGANVWREEGAFRIVIHTERGKKQTKLLEWGEQIATLFRGQVFAGVVCWEVSSVVIDDRNDSGNYFVGSLAVAYHHDLLG